MVSVSGVRGRVGEALTPELVAAYAGAFGAWARRSGAGRSVVVGRDSRVSGPLFHRVVIGALQAAGCDVIDVGLVPTPTVQLAVEHHHAAGGLAITASHNPIEWNALKFIESDGTVPRRAQGAAMRALLEDGNPYVAWNELGSVSQDDGAIARHIDLVLGLPQLNVEGIRRQGIPRGARLLSRSGRGDHSTPARSPRVYGDGDRRGDRRAFPAAPGAGGRPAWRSLRGSCARAGRWWALRPTRTSIDWRSLTRPVRRSARTGRWRWPRVSCWPARLVQSSPTCRRAGSWTMSRARPARASFVRPWAR